MATKSKPAGPIQLIGPDGKTTLSIPSAAGLASLKALGWKEVAKATPARRAPAKKKAEPADDAEATDLDDDGDEGE